MGIGADHRAKMQRLKERYPEALEEQKESRESIRSFYYAAAESLEKVASIPEETFSTSELLLKSIASSLMQMNEQYYLDKLDNEISDIHKQLFLFG